MTKVKKTIGGWDYPVTKFESAKDGHGDALIPAALACHLLRDVLDKIMEHRTKNEYAKKDIIVASFSDFRINYHSAIKKYVTQKETPIDEHGEENATFLQLLSKCREICRKCRHAKRGGWHYNNSTKVLSKDCWFGATSGNYRSLCDCKRVK